MNMPMYHCRKPGKDGIRSQNRIGRRALTTRKSSASLTEVFFPNFTAKVRIPPFRSAS